MATPDMAPEETIRRTESEVQTFIQAVKHVKGLRVGNSIEVSLAEVAEARKNLIIPGTYTLVRKSRHYKVVVLNEVKNLTITRTV